MRAQVCLPILAFTVIGCADPIATLNKELEKQGYIAYTTPLRFAGTGTLIGGSPRAMNLIAPPERCFPGISGGDSPLRFRDDTTLPNSKANFLVNVSVSGDLFKALGSSAPTIRAGAALNVAQAIELEFDGVHVEYIDSIRLVEYYRTKISEECRLWLDDVGFISQAIVADKMRFSFYQKDGGKIQLTVDNIKNLLNISADASWEIERGSTIVITSPKYIGYQLGKLRKEDNGMSLRRASKVMLNHWIFTSVGIFH